MNILDTAILLIFALFILAGLYKGFLSTILSIGSFIVSWGLGMAFMSPAASAVKNSESLYNMMLYYTEGSEYIGDAELARANIATVSSTQLNDIITKAEIPYPMGKAITNNIAREVFASDNITTLGEYFNQTIVCVFINILVFLVIFAVVRTILAFAVNGVDYAVKLPVLRIGDGALAMVAGVIRGMLALFLLFMLLPIVLTVLGKFDYVTDMLNSSVFTPFFYRSNFLLSLIPGS